MFFWPIWHCIVLVCVNGWEGKIPLPTNLRQTTPGFQTITKSRWIWTENMHVTSSLGHHREGIFFHSWVNASWPQWEDTLAILTSSTNGIWSGLATHIPAGLCRPPGNYEDRRMSMHYGPGAGFTTLHGCIISGLADPHEYKLTWRPWTDSRPLPGNLRKDPGKTGRHWRFRFAGRAPRRRTRRANKARHWLNVGKLLSRLCCFGQCLRTKCPLHVTALTGTFSAWAGRVESFCEFLHTCQMRTHLLAQSSTAARGPEPSNTLDMATGSSSDRATEEDTLVDAAVEPHEPPYGPPPPQNLFSLRLSQALVDAMAPNIQHQGAFLTKIQGRIIDCVGITAVLRPMTPNEFLERDVLHFSESPPPSELEDPEDTAPSPWTTTVAEPELAGHRPNGLKGVGRSSP